jgi:Na+/H+-dicarboxylate symporter
MLQVIIGMILGVDRLLDMNRTAVNLTGDLVACVLLGSKNTLKLEPSQV